MHERTERAEGSVLSLPPLKRTAPAVLPGAFVYFVYFVVSIPTYAGGASGTMRAARLSPSSSAGSMENSAEATTRSPASASAL